MMTTIAATTLLDALTPKNEGEPVNAHVVRVVAEPQPDFEAMRRAIQGDTPSLTLTDELRREPENRTVSENHGPSDSITPILG